MGGYTSRKVGALGEKVVGEEGAELGETIVVVAELGGKFVAELGKIVGK